MRHRIHATTTSTAPPSAVYALLTDVTTWPSWSDFASGRILTPASGDSPNGVGAVIELARKRSTSVERIVELIEDRQYGYELVKGLPLRRYRADVRLQPTSGGGTEISWSSTWASRTPVTGWVMRAVLGAFISRLVNDLADGAARSNAPVG